MYGIKLKGVPCGRGLKEQVSKEQVKLMED